MSVTITLNDQLAKRLASQAQVHRVSLEDYALTILGLAVKQPEELGRRSKGAKGQPARQRVRLPDGPWLDEMISPPFDLPRPGKARPVKTHRGRLRSPTALFA